MLKQIVGPLGLAIALATTAPAFGQSETPPTDQTPPTNQTESQSPNQTESQFVGFPIYSSDGEQLGQVVQVAMLDGKLRGVRAELGQFLGLGTATAIISADIVQQKPDRLEVAMTAEEVRQALSKGKQ